MHEHLEAGPGTEEHEGRGEQAAHPAPQVGARRVAPPAAGLQADQVGEAADEEEQMKNVAMICSTQVRILSWGDRSSRLCWATRPCGATITIPR